MYLNFPFILLLFISINCVFAIYKISLFRQKTPRENILATSDIPEYGVWLDWLKAPKWTNETLPLFRFLDSEFYGYVNVGNPGQPMKVIFDTAWSTSWILSKDCPSKSIGCWFHNKYDHVRSSTYQANNTRYIANEGTYNLTGYYSRDNISFAHSNVRQTFVEMVGVPYWNVFTKADGVIGLAMDRGDTTPFFYNVLMQTNITNPVFSIYLNRDKSSKKGGSIYLGVIQKKHIHVTNKVPDRITYVPVNAESTNWEFVMDRVVIIMGNKTYPICTENCIAFADTSSNSIITSKNYLKLINEKIRAKPLYFGRYEVDCDTVNKMPFVQFEIGGTKFNLTGPDYVQKVSVRFFTFCISAFMEVSTPSASDRWLLGGAFLSKFYSIYDLGTKRIGFVRAA